MRYLALLILTITSLPALAADAGDPSASVIPPQVSKRASELIIILAGKDADQCNAAYKELDKLGRLALPAIETAVRSWASASTGSPNKIGD